MQGCPQTAVASAAVPENLSIASGMHASHAQRPNSVLWSPYRAVQVAAPARKGISAAAQSVERTSRWTKGVPVAFPAQQAQPSTLCRAPLASAAGSRAPRQAQRAPHAQWVTSAKLAAAIARPVKLASNGIPRQSVLIATRGNTRMLQPARRVPIAVLARRVHTAVGVVLCALQANAWTFSMAGVPVARLENTKTPTA